MENCAGQCGFCNAVSRAIDRGIPVIAAAGNKFGTNDEERVNCPANRDEVIAVGSMLTVCKCKENHPTENVSDPPEGAFYLNSEDDQVREQAPEDPICGQKGCTDKFDCITNQCEKTWANTLPKRDKPDIFAPCYISYHTTDKVQKSDIGSSFAAPVVSGAIATILSELSQEMSEEETIPPGDLRDIVRESGMSIGRLGSDKKKLDGTKLLKNCKEYLQDSE